MLAGSVFARKGCVQLGLPEGGASDRMRVDRVWMEWQGRSGARVFLDVPAQIDNRQGDLHARWAL